MKKNLFLICCCIYCIPAYAQLTSSGQSTADDFLKKSIHQKKISKIMLLGGAGLIVTSFMISRGDKTYDGFSVGPFSGDRYENDKLKSIVGAAGLISMIGGLTLSSIASKNKKKSNSQSISLINQKIFIPGPNRLLSLPSVSLRLKI